MNIFIYACIHMIGMRADWYQHLQVDTYVYMFIYIYLYAFICLMFICIHIHIIDMFMNM
jgi:hypothetical protein